MLVQQGLQKSLDGKRKKPLTMTDDEWKELDAKALSTIRLCLADDVLFNIVGEKSTTRLWSKLESLYMEEYLTNIIYLKKDLYSMRMKSCTKIAGDLNVFNTRICQLSLMDVKIDEEDKAINIFCILPECWGQLISSIILSTTDTLEFDKVVG